MSDTVVAEDPLSVNALDACFYNEGSIDRFNAMLLENVEAKN